MSHCAWPMAVRMRYVTAILPASPDRCPICSQAYPNSPGHLVWGDEKGCVGILSFTHPSKSLFHSTSVTFNVSIITSHYSIAPCMLSPVFPLQRLEDETPEVAVRYGHAHSDWVCQVGWSGPAHCIVSAARSPSPSLLIQHVRAHRKQYIFRVRMVIPQP